jgi:hypothetical protein
VPSVAHAQRERATKPVRPLAVDNGLERSCPCLIYASSIELIEVAANGLPYWFMKPAATARSEH